MAKPILNMKKALEAFHAAVNTANEQYAATVKMLQTYAGSQGYDSDMRNAQYEGAIAISNARNDLYTSTNTERNAALEKLDKVASSVAAPTQEELNTLTALKLLNKPTEENIRDAAAIVKNPICVSALREIMSANGITGIQLYSVGLSVSDAKEMLQTIYENMREAAAETILNETPQEMISNKHYAAFNFRNDYTNTETFVSELAHYADVEACKQLVSMIDG